jgi:transposase-like protein
MPARSLFDRPRWTTDDAREVITALGRSGQPVSVFAAEHGLDPERVYLWRRRLGASAELTTFREVVVHPTRSRDESVPDGAAFEIVFAAGQVCGCQPRSRRQDSLACSKSSLGLECAEPSAKRSALHGDAACRRTQGSRQSHGARARRAVP